MSRFQITSLPLTGLQLLQRLPLGDSRGFLDRIFCADELALAGWTGPVAQVNHTYTARRGTVRGMHFQRPPHAELKLVNCLRGEVWDVAIDLRTGSPTFLHWHAERLCAGNHRALLIPQGFAHGFQTLTDDVEMLYLHSTPYQPSAEDGLDATDPLLAIDWPQLITERSARDQTHFHLTSSFVGIEIV